MNTHTLAVWEQILNDMINKKRMNLTGHEYIKLIEQINLSRNINNELALKVASILGKYVQADQKQFRAPFHSFDLNNAFMQRLVFKKHENDSSKNVIRPAQRPQPKL